MITFSKIRSTVLSLLPGSLALSAPRIIKVEQYGTKTAEEVSTFGCDGNPVENMTAIYADTGETGDAIIIGYINQRQLAKVGERRVYSLKPDGSGSFYTWLRNDGIYEIGGYQDNMVRYSQLNSKLQAEKNAINAELTKIQAAISTLGGTYTKVDITLDLTDARIDEIKTMRLGEAASAGDGSRDV